MNCTFIETLPYPHCSPLAATNKQQQQQQYNNNNNSNSDRNSDRNYLNHFSSLFAVSSTINALSLFLPSLPSRVVLSSAQIHWIQIVQKSLRESYVTAVLVGKCNASRSIEGQERDRDRDRGDEVGSTVCWQLTVDICNCNGATNSSAGQCIVDADSVLSLHTLRNLILPRIAAPEQNIHPLTFVHSFHSNNRTLPSLSLRSSPRDTLWSEPNDKCLK